MGGHVDRARLYIEDAWEFYRRGAAEVREGVEKGDAYMVRDGAEKLWNAVVQAANALLFKHLGTTPASHWERRRKLYEMEDRHEEVKRLGLADRYSARERNLHGLTFYEGIIDKELLAKEIDKVKKYIEDVEKIVEQAAQP